MEERHFSEVELRAMLTGATRLTAAAALRPLPQGMPGSVAQRGGEADAGSRVGVAPPWRAAQFASWALCRFDVDCGVRGSDA